MCHGTPAGHGTSQPRRPSRDGSRHRRQIIVDAGTHTSVSRPPQNQAVRQVTLLVHVPLRVAVVSRHARRVGRGERCLFGKPRSHPDLVGLKITLNLLYLPPRSVRNKEEKKRKNPFADRVRPISQPATSVPSVRLPSRSASLASPTPFPGMQSAALSLTGGVGPQASAVPSNSGRPWQPGMGSRAVAISGWRCGPRLG
jgi:hypothetical protein